MSSPGHTEMVLTGKEQVVPKPEEEVAWKKKISQKKLKKQKCMAQEYTLLKKKKKQTKVKKTKTDKHGEPQGWYLAGSTDLELRKGKKSHQTRDGGLGSSGEGEFTHGWRALGEERSPRHRKVPAFKMPERRGSEAQEDEGEEHRGKEAGGRANGC